MSEQTKEVTSIKNIFANVNVKARFEAMLGEKSQSFITTVLQIVNQNAMLKRADPKTIMTAAATAASLDLNVNPNLGYAYIIPYEINTKDADGNWSKRVVAQFQMGYKGFIQLAQRSGQYKSIVGLPVFENQLKGWNPLLEEIDADFTIAGEGNPIGYVGAFKLLNGFTKVVYWTADEVNQHAGKYSKTFKKKNSYGKLMKSPWNDPDQYDTMAIKTILKMMLSKFGPMEIESPISKAITADQSVQLREGQHRYIDNPSDVPQDENGNTIVIVSSEEILENIYKCETAEALEEYYNEHKAEISRDINLVSAIGDAKKRFDDVK